MPLIEGMIQGTMKWKKFRSEYITSTMASSIMGMNVHTSILKLYHILEGVIEPDPVNLSMTIGSELESHAREAYIKETGLNVEPAVWQSDDFPIAIASLDGLIISNNLPIWAVEIKCSEKYYNLAKNGIIPKSAYCQMQHQLMVTGLSKMHYYAFWCDKGILMEERREDAFIMRMKEEEQKFYTDWKNHIPPQIDVDKDLYCSEQEWNTRIEQTWKDAQC